MLPGEVPSQELTQAIRAVDKNLPTSSIPPPTPDDIFYVECHVDPETQKPVVLWDDILQAFEDAVQVRNNTKIVPYLKTKDFRILEPRRIVAVPDTVLDVVVVGPLVDQENSPPKSVPKESVPVLPSDKENTGQEKGTVQDTTTSSAVRRNPVYGLEETAMDNYSHIDKPVSFPMARGPHASLDDHSPTTKNLLVPPYPENGNNPQLQTQRSTSIHTPMARDLVQTTISASQGDKTALVELGDIYKDGKVVPQNYHAAIDWYLKAAQQGNPDGQHRIGALYYYGHGVPQNYLQAMDWYLKAADQGHVDAQYNIGVLYGHGRGVSQDYARALEWYLKAVQGEHVLAMFCVGIMYEYGRCVTQSYEDAVAWYRKAADRGHVGSKNKLEELKGVVDK
ncbi:hypothetical protein BGZ90_009656 [Linnemannia elongata]|nr:hypothetical protein BGZ90_009656 [Linnemannia elongata]